MYKRDGIKMADGAIASYNRQMNEFQTELKGIVNNQYSIEKELKATLHQLTDSIVNSIEARKVQEVADECDAPFLPKNLVRLEAIRLKNEERIEEISNEQAYLQRDDLLDSQSGQYTLEILNKTKELNIVTKALDVYSFKSFQWLYKRGFHLDKEPSNFQNFLRVITFANKREETACEKVCEKINCHSFYEAAKKFDSLQEICQGLTENLALWQGRKKSLLDMISEKKKLENWNLLFPVQVLQELREELFNHLHKADYQKLHKQIRPAGKVLLARCHALQEKVVYMEGMQKFLRKEIRDRKNRIQSIGNVRSKWARKPYGPLRGNNSKWLQAVPAMKKNSTRKRTRWIRTMNHNIYDYDDYGSYCCFMDMGTAFLAYDAFSYRQEERMPYEGFSSEVIEDIQIFRDEHEMEKADFRDFKNGLDERGEYNEDWEQSEEDSTAEAAAAAIAAEEILDFSEEADFADVS